MEHAAIEHSTVLWFGGWLVAVFGLFVAGVNASSPQSRGWRRRLAGGALLASAVVSVVIANIGLALHDAHIDLTREKLFTPSAEALQVVDRLTQPVAVTYFYRSDDPLGKRAGDILEIMARRNSKLSVRAVDPDRDPSLAADYGVKIYNAAVIAANDRQVVVRSTDETEFAIGIQRVLRERTVGVCFIEGHGEYASTNYEFHTHLDSAVGHSHDDANSLVIDTTHHGYGRFRRSLEGLGFDVEVIDLARPNGIPSNCQAVIDAGPRTTLTPAESAAITTYLTDGGNLLLMIDLGYELEPGLRDLIGKLGLAMPQSVIIDPQNHQGTDTTMVSVTAYDPHPITRNVSYTFFPGVRPLVGHAAGEATLTSLVQSSASSVSHPVRSAGERAIAPASAIRESTPAPQMIAAAIEGALSRGGKNFRAVVIGDADFASNSFYPYAANSDFAIAVLRWLLREDAEVAVQSRIPTPPVLMLTASQMRAVFLLVEVLIPSLVGLIGVAVWWRRR